MVQFAAGKCKPNQNGKGKQGSFTWQPLPLSTHSSVGQKATTTQDTLLPGLKNNFLVLSTLIHGKRGKILMDNFPQDALARSDSCSQPRHQRPTQPQGQRPPGDPGAGQGDLHFTPFWQHLTLARGKGQGQSQRTPEGQLCPHLTCALPSDKRKPLLWRWIPLDTPLVEVFPFCTSEG